MITDSLRRSFEHRAAAVLIAATATLAMLLAPATVGAQMMTAKSASTTPSAMSAPASPVPSALFQDLHWRLIGPFRGGRTLTASGVPGEPNHFYFGAVNGGVWESKDAGRTWKPIFDEERVGSIGALAVAPSNPKVLYVGTGEADMRSDIAQGKGVYKSIDGGKSWTFLGLADSQQIGKIAIDPRDPNVVYVAALGHPYGPNKERGLYKSTDGGKSWSKILGPNENTGAIDVVLEPHHPDTVYAALWQTRRPPWNIYPPSDGPGSGLFKSTDGGAHWSEIKGNGFPANPGRIGIAVSPSEPSRVYALVDAHDGGLYRSDDGGAHWKRMSNDPRIWGRGWYFAGVTVEPENADIVYVCNTNIYRSTDGGKTFLPVLGDMTGDDYHELWIDPDHPASRILASDQGTRVSVNGGKTWSSWYNQPTAQLYHVSTDNRFPYWVYGPQQDSGAIALPSRTNSYDGVTLEQFNEVTVGGEAQNVIVDPLDPDMIYGGTVSKLDRRTDQTRSIDPTIDYPDLWRRTWTLPLAFSPKDPHVLYFAQQRIFRTDDGGLHWTMISPDLTRKDPGAPPNLDPITAKHDLGTGPRRGVVYALAPSPLDANLLWAGTDDGLVWVTRDDGAHWENVTPPELTPWSKVGIIEASHFDPETAYVAVDRHRLDDRKPYIYKTTDGGKSWTLIVAGIPNGHFVNAVREDPERRGLLYAATEEGVSFSLDDGAHWQSLELNLPPTSVRDLVVHGNDLVVATHGRGIWILDDMSLLRQLDPAVVSADSWLFKPATAYRFHFAGFTGTPMPKDEPMAPNPPNGTYIDYALKSASSSPVTLEIRDASNVVVGHWSSADKVAKPDIAHMRMAPVWFIPPSHLSAAAGMHRFVWNLHYFSHGGNQFRGGGGIWAPPGEYTVTLSADGKTMSQSLTVAPDPRVKLPQSAYRAQFELAKKIGALANEVGKAAGPAGRLQEEVSARRAKASGRLAKELDSFQEKLSDLTGVKPAPNPLNAWSFPPKQIRSFRWLQGAIGSLMQVVDGADAAPSPDARASYTKLEALAGETFGAWKLFTTTELPKINKRLRRAHMKPLELGKE